MRMQPTHYAESMSRPCVVCEGLRLILLDAGFVRQEPICWECTVICSSRGLSRDYCLGNTPLCIPCAIKLGFQEIGGEFFCENCACEFEPELEMERR